MFASKTLVEHLLRGVVGVGAFVTSGLLAPTHSVLTISPKSPSALWPLDRIFGSASGPSSLALAILSVGLVALRGCPMCWTMGLMEAIAAKVRGRTASNVCIHGTCALQKPPV